MTQLVLRNRQRLQSINLRLLKELTHHLIDKLRILEFELGVYFVSPSEMARLNETFLNHTGSTDVISFHYPAPGSVLRGEIFISVGDAMRQAMEYGTTWQSEVVRYLIHGVLHLKGYDDLTPNDRRVMKRHENRLVREISREFPIEQLSVR